MRNNDIDRLKTEGGGFAVDPKEILHALRRRKWIILACTVLVSAAVVAGTLRQPKIYSATAQIIIDPALPKVLADGVDVDSMAEQARVERVFNNTQYTTIRSRAVLHDVAVRLDLANDVKFKETYGLSKLEGEDLDKGLERVLLANTSVVPERVSRIVNLVVEDQDPLRAVKIANALGQAYIDYSLERRLDSTRNAGQWLNERVEEFAKKIEEAEKSLYDFKRSNTLVSVSLEDRQNMTASSMAIINSKTIETQARLIELQSKRTVLQEQLSRPDSTDERLTGIGASPVISDLRTSLATLKKNQAELSSRYGEKHPSMLAITRQADETRAELKKQVQLVIDEIDGEMAALRATETGLNRQMDVEKEGAMALSNLALDYNKLTRDLSTVRDTYQSLLKRQTETDLSGLLKSNFVRWFQQAEPRLGPIRPLVPQNAAVGLLAGFLLGLLIAVGGVLLDNTVHSQADVEHVLKLPFLGILPRIRDEEEVAKVGNERPRNRDLYIVQNPKSAVAECARSVRTNLMFMGTDNPLRMLLLTSAGPAEGKTTTVINLGITMATAGNRVLIVDTDLRKPRLHRTFGVSGETGITSVLLDTATLDQAIKSTEVVGLDLLPCGPLPPNPAELLHSARFQAVLKQLGERYDRVVFDSPPVGAVTDAAILSKLVDGTVLVVQASKAAKDAVRRARNRLTDVDANVVGVVLNDCDIEAGSYGYQHYYYYNRYGYGSDAEKEAKA